MAGKRVRQPQTSVWLAERAERTERPGGAERAERAGGAAPARKAAPAGLDRDRIVAAAIRLLDAEGLAKFSMRRLAAELGVSAMSVYWYVENKDDLLELALDAVNGEARLPDPAAGGDWRDDLRLLATEFRRAMVAHPWASQLIGVYFNLGPNALAMSTTALRCVDKSGLPRAQAPGALAALYQFVYGYATVEGRWVEHCREAGLTQDELFQQITNTLVGRPGFEEQTPIMEERVRISFEEGRNRDFTLALETVIAGLEVMAERYGEGAGGPSEG